MCVCVCVLLAVQIGGNFDHMLLCDGHTKTHTGTQTHTHTYKLVMSGFKFRLFSPGQGPLSSSRGKTPIIHLWHDSILSAPPSQQREAILYVPPVLHLFFFFFFFFFFYISPPVFFILVCLCFFQLHFSSPPPHNLLFFSLSLPETFIWGFDYSRASQREEEMSDSLK